MRRSGLMLLTAGLWLSMVHAARANEQVYQKVLPGTVWVMSPRGFDKVSSGSGALVNLAKRWVITNYHVVEDQSEVVIFFPTEVDGQVANQRDYYLRNRDKVGIRGRVIARDARRDLTVIELPRLPAAAKPVPLAKRSASPGQRIHSIGNPGLSPALWVYTAGTVRQVVADRWQARGNGRMFSFEAWVVLTQSAVNPGDSGGPVVNDAGELVGVVSGTGPGQQNSTCIDVREVKTVLAAAAVAPAPPEVAKARPQEPFDRNRRTINNRELGSGDRVAPPPPSVRLPEGGVPQAAGGDARVEKALGKAKLKYEVQPDGNYRVSLTLASGLQDVILNARTNRYQHLELRRIWALAFALDGPLPGDLACHLLRLNGTGKLGAWELHLIQGRVCVVYAVRLPADADGPTLRAAIELIAGEAVALRQQLSIITRGPGE
jgi:serine protease Do